MVLDIPVTPDIKAFHRVLVMDVDLTWLIVGPQPRISPAQGAVAAGNVRGESGDFQVDIAAVAAAEWFHIGSELNIV
jgi:hypothetical protein